MIGKRTKREDDVNEIINQSNLKSYKSSNNLEADITGNIEGNKRRKKV